MTLPERKNVRLKEYDYSNPGAYFITLCTDGRKKILSDIIVGQGLAPAETNLTLYGKIAEKQLFCLEERFDYVKIDKYVIMPDHIHAIIVLKELTAEASLRPTIPDILCVYKSLTTRDCKKAGFKEKRLFQSSFFDHVIRNRQDYEEIWNYIDTNPCRWVEKYAISK